jgi:hypothetical protein
MRTVTLIFGEKEPKTQRFGVRARDQKQNGLKRITESWENGAQTQRFGVQYVRSTAFNLMREEETEPPKRSAFELNENSEKRITILWVPYRRGKSSAAVNVVVRRKEPCFSHVFAFHKRKRDGKYGNTVKIAKRRRWIGAEVAPVRCNSRFSQVSVLFFHLFL